MTTPTTIDEALANPSHPDARRIIKGVDQHEIREALRPHTDRADKVLRTEQVIDWMDLHGVPYRRESRPGLPASDGTPLRCLDLTQLPGLLRDKFDDHGYWLGD